MMTDKLNTFLKCTIIAGLFAILVVPLVVANPNFFPYITGKAYMFRVIVEIIAAAWVILMVRDSSYRPSKKPIALAVAGLTFFALISDLAGVEVMRSIWSNYERMEGWVMIIHLFLYFFVATSVLKTKRLWNYWLGFTLAISLVIAIWGLFQFGCFNPDNPQSNIKSTSFCTNLSRSKTASFFGGLGIMQGDRLNSTLGNAGYYGVYTLMHIFIAGILLMRSRREKWKPWTPYIISVAAICNLLALYYTATRGSMLGLIAGVFVSGVVYLWLTYQSTRSIVSANSQSNSSLPKQWYIVLISLIAVIVVVLGIWLARHSSYVQSTRFLSRYANISISDTKSQARNYIWPMAIKGFIENPILGWGQENFNYVFNKYYDSRMWSQEQWFDRAHNVFLDWLIAGGILGFVSYLALYLIPLWYTFKRSTLAIGDRSLLVGLLIAYGIHNVFIFDNISSYILFFGLLAYINRDWLNQGVEKPSTSTTDKDVVNYVITPIILILLIVSIYFVNIRSLRANQGLARSLNECQRSGVTAFDSVLAINDPTGKEQIREQLWTCTLSLLQRSDVPLEAKNEAFSVSMEEINKQINATKYDARIYFFAGSVLSLAGNHEESRVAFAKAHELSPNKPSFIMGEAGSLLALKKNKEALDLFKVAYDLSPDYPIAKVNYAIALIDNNQVDEAIKIVGDENSAKLNTQYVSALYEKKRFKELIPIMQYRIKIEPTNVKNYISLAAIYLDPSINDVASARKAILQIKEVDPKNAAMVETLIKKYNL